MTGRRKPRESASVPPGTAPFVERARELSTLRGLLKDTKASRGTMVSITGEPGIGKTRLAHHFAAVYASPSVASLWARCHPDPDVPAYWPWKQVLSRYAERRDDSALQWELGAAARDIVPLVPQLALRFPEFARPSTHEPPEARQRVFEGIIQFLKNAACDQALLVVIDDLQWIDGASLSLLELFASECRESRLMLVAAFRATDFPDSQTETRVGSLLQHGHHLALNGFNEVAVGKLIRAISGKVPSSRLTHALFETTQGNPLFVDQLTRFIAARGAWDSVNLAKLGLPRDLKLAIQGWLARFSERARSILAHAAVIGKSGYIDVLAKVVELSVPELLDALNEPFAARVLQEVPGSPGEYSFSHALIRDALYDGLAPLERLRIHRRVAEAILEVHGPNLNEQLSAIAHHFFQVARAGGSEAAREYCTRAGDQALDAFAYEEAIGHYRRALTAFDLGKGDERSRGNLLLRLGKAQHAAGDHAQAKLTFREAIAIARSAADDELLARGALGFAGSWNAPLLLPDEQVLELLKEAANRLHRSHPALRARLIARRVHEHWWSLTREQARVQLDEALELAERSAEPNAIAHVLHIRHLALWDHEDLNGRLNSALRIVELRERIEKELVLEGYSWLMANELERGNIPGFEAALGSYAELAQYLRSADHVGSAQIRHVARDLLKGRLRDVAKACEHPSKEATSAHHLVFWVLLRFILHRELDTVSEVEALIRDLANAASAWPAMRYGLVCTLATAGSPDAQFEFNGISANEFRDVPSDFTRLALLGMSAEACTLVGSAASARTLYSHLLPFAGRHMQMGNGALYFDSVSHMLARLAAQLEDWDTADRHFSDALRQAQALGAGPRATHIQFHWAVMLVRSSRMTETPRARSLLEAAAKTARHFELSGLIPKIEAQLNALRGGEPALAPQDPARLTNTIGPAPAPPPAVPSAPADGARYVFRCEGEFWTLQFGVETIRLKDTRGLRFIATLLRSPGTYVHALELASGSEGRAFRRSSAGSVLDAKARDAYRQRLQELTREQAQAVADNDPPRAARARRESEILTEQLAVALGLGGRSRRSGAETERARVNVTRSIRSAIARVTTKSPGLAHHLSTSIRTGTFCHYVADPSRKVEWEL